MKNRMLLSVLNVLFVSLLFSPNVFSQSAVVSVVPPFLTQVLSPPLGENFKVKVRIENGQNVAGYQVMLEYDSSALELVSYSRGDYLPADAFYGKPWVKTLTISNSEILSGQKRVRFAATSAPQSRSGNGTLATLTFKLLRLEASSLNLVAGNRSIHTGTLLSDKDGNLSFPRVVNWTGFAEVSRPLISDQPASPIQEVAVSAGSTYFVVSTKPPSREVGVVHREYKITVHIPDGVEYYTFPIPQPEDKREAVLNAGVNLFMSLSIGAAGTAIPVLGPAVTIFGFLKELYDIYSTEIILEGDIELLLTNPNDAPNAVLDTGQFVFLLKSRVERIEYTVEESLAQIDGTAWKQSQKYEWTLAEGYKEVLLAPAAKPMTLADYPPFQQLPLEVQAYLLQHFGEGENAEAWQIPEEPALLVNYPNPFNPETWIPYQLAEPADVSLTIYDIHGRVVRDLNLGHQRAGTYQSKSRAAYWDGRNTQGEPVASGVYFYTLKAGDFTATRKMLIRK